MTRIFRAQHLVEATHIRNLLDSAGIATFLRNENLVRLSGEVPFDQCWPEVWVADDKDIAAARRLMSELNLGTAGWGPAWTCVHCDEWQEGQFTACWRCGAQRPAG